MISDLLFPKQHSKMHSQILKCCSARLVFPDLTELIILEGCVQETNFTVTQSNACSKCCSCFSRLKHLVCDERCAESPADGFTMPFCSSGSDFHLLPCLCVSEKLPDTRRRKLCPVVSLVCGLPAGTLMKKPVMPILMLVLFGVVSMLYCP